MDREGCGQPYRIRRRHTWREAKPRTSRRRREETDQQHPSPYGVHSKERAGSSTKPVGRAGLPRPGGGGCVVGKELLGCRRGVGWAGGEEQHDGRAVMDEPQHRSRGSGNM